MSIETDKLDKISVKKILREYANKYKLYDDFSASIRRLLLLFLRSENINFHSITFRPKEVYSLKQKIKRKALTQRFYKKLDDINDLAGVRVILYFKSDISKVINIINHEFIIHHGENVDKLDLDKRTGYSSIHRVVSINKERQLLKEYFHFQNLKCEVQIRTVLQNAWAEIEHGIGYKPSVIAKGKVGKNIRKIFKLTSKQLERVDNNFVEIHDIHNRLLNEYRKKIEQRKLNIPINCESVESYLAKKALYQEIPESKKNLLIADYLKVAEENHLKTIKELEKLVSEKEKI